MNFRVPAQAADGSLVELIYNTIDGAPPTAEESAAYSVPVLTAKPIIGVYVYGPVISFEDFSQSGFPGHGKRDAFAAVSLDDGATWKRTNLSNSADKSSFTLTDPIPDPADPDCHLPRRWSPLRRSPARAKPPPPAPSPSSRRPSGSLRTTAPASWMSTAIPVVAAGSP
jgi:hypothetical protein